MVRWEGLGVGPGVTSELIHQLTAAGIEAVSSYRVTPRYYTNPGNRACFPCALANLLVELGDPATAESVYETFWQHRLAQNYTCSLFLLSRYVADMTSQKYAGALQMNVSPERTSRILGGFAAEKRAAAEEEIRSGRVRYTPSLRLVPGIIVIVPRESSCHAMIYRGHHYYIDDGQLSFYPFAASYVIATMEIELQLASWSLVEEESPEPLAAAG